MLSLEPKDLMAEIRAARAFIKPYLMKRAEMIQRSAGSNYREGSQTEMTPENYPFSYKEFVGPQLLFGLPQCQIRPVGNQALNLIAQGLKFGCNAWARETGYDVTADEVLDDAFYGWGVTKRGIERRGNYAGGGLSAVQGDFEARPNYPFCVRVDPRCFFFDARCKNLRKARIMGEWFERDLEDVQKDDRYDPEAVAKLTERDKEAREKETDPFPTSEDLSDADRKRIVLYEIYVPEHGCLITMAEQGPTDGLILRNEQFFGPDEGPYTVWGLSSVAGEPVPLSPLTALWDQFLELNEHRRAAAESAASHKKIGVASAAGSEDAKNIKNARPGEIVTVGDANSVKDFELGGVSDKQLEWIQFARDGLDRDLGYTNAQRGYVEGSATATESSIAQGNSDLRISKMSARIRRCITRDFRGVAWYLFHSSSMAPIQFTATDPATRQSMPALFIPGPWQGGFVQVPTPEGGFQTQYQPPQPVESDFTDYFLEIEGKSIEKQDDAILQKRAQDELQMISGLAQTLAAYGIGVNWPEVIDRYGRAFGESDFSKTVLLMGEQSPVMRPQFGTAQIGQQQGALPMQQPALPAPSPATLPGLMNNATAGVRPGMA